MAIDIEQLKHFQSEQLEQKNIQTSARLPIHTEWALVEIVILLTGNRFIIGEQQISLDAGQKVRARARCRRSLFALSCRDLV
jgi:hypothetical protein